MASRVRLNLVVSAGLAAFLQDLADTEETTQTEMIRRGLSILKAYRQQIAAGRTHIGFVADATKLDAEIVGILNF